MKNSEFSFETVGRGKLTGLLIPGGPGLSAATMRDDALLLGEIATSYLIDPPGTGDTPRPIDEGGYLPDSVATFYRTACASLALQPDFILGASYGGLVAVNMAAQDTRLTRALVLVSTVISGIEITNEWDFAESMLTRHQSAPWYGSAREVFDDWTDLILRATTASEVEEYNARILPLYFDSPDDPAVRARIEEIAAETRFDLEAMKIWESGLYQRVDAREAATNITCPTLILSGESDWLAGPPVSRKTAKLVPGSTLRIIPNCGHMPVVEQPGSYRSLVTDFLHGALDLSS